jgi:tetratricopeptide (TPR) repeat protein
MQTGRNIPIKRYLSRRKLGRFKKEITKNPGDPFSHKKIGDVYGEQKKWVEAIAEYRTSLSLGAGNDSVYLSLANAYSAFGQSDLARSVLEKIRPCGNDRIIRQAENIQSKLGEMASQPLSEFNHNRYYRLKTIADHITNLYGNTGVSILDIGGGDGALSLFLPDCHYALAEPTVNGLSVNDFSEKSFDIVVACHVLEHIPLHERNKFLGELASKAKDYVILLNPFFQPESYVEERLKLIIELINSPWAREHLNCTLPKIEEIEDFASKHNYELRIFPNGSLAVTLAFIFLDHYAFLAGGRKELEKINNFFNTLLFNKLTDPVLPTAYTVEIVLNAHKAGKNP